MKSGIFIGMLLFYILGNTYIFIRIGQILPRHNTYLKILLILIALLLCGSMFVALFAGDRMPFHLTSFLYKTGTSWSIIFLYFIMFLLLRDLVIVTNKFLHYIPSAISSKSNFHSFSTLTAIGCACVLLSIGYVKYYQTERMEISIPITKSLTSGGVKIVMLSDMHLGYGIGNKELNQWIKNIDQEKPDIILIAGDLIDNSINALNHQGTEHHLRQLKAPLGVYACPGNHEYISNIKESEEFLRKSGITLLRDSALLISNAFYVIGRDDRINPNRKSIEELTHALDSSKPLILLDHQPYNLEESADNQIDLHLSGHTHRGQVFPINLITDKIYELSHGYLQKKDTHFYVSSGIGIWGGKFRIGSRSEYVVIRLQSSANTPL